MRIKIELKYLECRKRNFQTLCGWSADLTQNVNLYLLWKHIFMSNLVKPSLCLNANNGKMLDDIWLKNTCWSISFYDAGKNLYGQIQELQEGVIWRKAAFLLARKAGKTRHWGQGGALSLWSAHCCAALWKALCSELWWAMGSSDWKDKSWLGRGGEDQPRE